MIVSNATSDDIQIQAIKEGMVTMQLDGFIKALRGQTTIEEILRVTAEMNKYAEFNYTAVTKDGQTINGTIDSSY